MILLAEHDEPSLAAKKKRQHVALETPTSPPKNRVWNFFDRPLGRPGGDTDLSWENATGSVQYSYKNASGQGYYYTRDHLGSVREMCSSTGTITSRMAYDCFGRVTVVSGTNLPTKQYAGYYYHAPSGLDLTKRVYDPDIGRWPSRDSIGERGGINLYEFDSNNPVNKVDISGRSPLAIAAVGAPFVACALYAQVLKDWVKSHYGDKGSGDALEHCFLSCRLSRVCGGPIAIIAGSVNEIKDQADGDNTPAGSYDDLKSDFACISTESVVLGAPGGWVSQACRPSCAKCCADKIKWGTYNRP